MFSMQPDLRGIQTMRSDVTVVLFSIFKITLGDDEGPFCLCALTDLPFLCMQRAFNLL